MNGVLRYYKLCWNVLNSIVSCTEAEGILPHGRHCRGGSDPTKTYWKDVYCACESLRFRETRGLNSRVVRARITGAGSCGTQYGYLIPIPIPPNVAYSPWRGVGEVLGELKSLAGAGDEGEGSGWLRDLWIRDITWEIRDTLLRSSWLREARERPNAPVWLGQFPRSEGKHRGVSPGRKQFGGGPVTLRDSYGKKNQASATVQAHTCTEPLIHSEAARFQEHRGLVDRGDGAVVEWESSGNLGWWGPRTPLAARSDGD